ncbi:MAG TPA: protein kinase, partial [Candidatus Eisenbacteria bacterium]|nr:protein kinase [Candidatus Eisenbacteria bacterium]
MALAPGSRIGNYEIVAWHGAGGMGEIYRARDTRLDRIVAIKALPPAFASDPQRRGHFEREARLLAALNHPNIAAIYGLEDAAGATYLVLEFVDGETLAERLSRGALSARETLEIGIQVAAAIEAAHEREIVHRDLKPGNVMLDAKGAVKVLDFGLAKGGAREDGSGADLSASPTVALAGTAEGVILGTAPYMSPEQARGLRVDRRSDVWAFGCVLFECLTGRQTFRGDTVSDVIARILERDPEWGSLPGTVPTRLRDLIERCLTKDVAQRPRDIGDLRREMIAILQQLSSPSGAHARLSAEPPSLAVLYFEDLSGGTESEYFCAGITEDILTDLSKIKGLRVASRNAVARYRGQTVDLPKVAAELGVRAVLEGSVRRAGDRVRISAQLINAADGFHLWAERYDRKLDDVFTLQEEIAKSIAEALRVTLTPAETATLLQDRPDDVRAYDLYLRGRQLYGQYTRESLSEALDLFRQALQIDPNYALAWAGTADCHGQMLQYEFAEDIEETARLGLEAAQRAVAINPKLAEGHKAEALVWLYRGDKAASDSALRRAIVANPRYTPAVINVAVSAFADADLAMSERCVRRVLEIDPQEAFAITWLASLLHVTGRDEESLAATRRQRQTSNERFYVTSVYTERAWTEFRRGEFEAVARTLREGLADDADPSNLRAIEAALTAYTGPDQEARRLLAEFQETPRLGPPELMLLSGAALRLGEPERALRWLGRKFLHRLAPWYVRLDPELHALLDREPFAPRRAP